MRMNWIFLLHIECYSLPFGTMGYYVGEAERYPHSDLILCWVGLLIVQEHAYAWSSGQNSRWHATQIQQCINQRIKQQK
jgi:hypothetical protein